MAKSRRERDRPKCAPTSLYNANKRVLLKYDSDDEDAAPTAPQPVADNVSADYVIAEYPESEVEQVPEVKSAVLDEATVKTTEPLPFPRRELPKNPNTGQWPALGSIEGQGEDEYGREEDEAMAYLRAVRSERHTIPELLTAPRTTSHQDLYESGTGDHRGFFEDGAYVACAPLGPALPRNTTVEPQEAFTAALKHRFYTHRQQLHLSPTADEVAALDESHPISFPQGNNRAYADWLRCLRSTPPHLAQLRSMEQDVVFGLLEMVQKHSLLRTKETSPTVSAWIWALLARLDDVGTMNNDQVWILREFGKKAVLVQLSLDNPEGAEALERESGADAEPEVLVKNGDELTVELEDTAETTTDETTQSPTRTKPEQGDSTVKNTTTTPKARENTLATLDMIITIIGEVFGQRDMLEFRKPWTEEEYVPETETAVV